MLSLRRNMRKPLQFSIESPQARFELQAQEQQFTACLHRAAKVGTGVPLLLVIQSTVPQTDTAVKHHELKFMVIVEVHDGRPLSGRESPSRLVVSIDKAAVGSSLVSSQSFLLMA